MAVNAVSYHPSQWKACILPETTVGTALVTAMHILNVDHPITISDNVFQVSDPRSGTGRTLKAADHTAIEKGTLKTISISGIADQTTFPIIVENGCNTAKSATPSDGIVLIPYNFTGTPVLFGGAATGNIHTLTFALVSPISNKSRIYAGCVVSEFGWVDDSKAEGGRRRFNATLITRDVPTNSTTDPTYANSGVIYPTSYSIWDYDTASVGRKQVFGVDVVLSKLEVSIKSNPIIGGVGTDGQGETYNWGIPIIDVTGSVDCKWDTNTEPIYQ